MGFLFGTDLASRIIDALRPEGGLKKTQTRRLVKENEFFQKTDGRISAVYTSTRRKKWCVEKDYAISVKRGGVGVARIHITGIRLEPLCDITDEDVRAEGFETRQEFFERLFMLYGKKLDLAQSAWAINFEYVENSYQGGL